MSQSAVSAAVLAALSAISGVASVSAGIGDANPSMPVECPLIEYSVGEPVEESLTCGPNRMIGLYYQVDIRVMLGMPDMLAGDAEAVKLPLVDRLRAAFTVDPTLGGVCLWCELLTGKSNLATFRDIEDYPTLNYQLNVEEYTNANVAAP